MRPGACAPPGDVTYPSSPPTGPPEAAPAATEAQRAIGGLVDQVGGVLLGSPEPIRTESATATRWEHVLDARAVGDADDIHGNRVSTFWTRSWLTRLVIETTDGPQMYEVTSWRAKHAAHTITTERRASHAR